MHRGFAKVYRKFLEWEWYEDVPCKTLYLHCLLKANHQQKKYKGKEIAKGSFVTGRGKLSEQTGLTEQQIRTALNKLVPDYLNVSSTSHGTVIFVIDFDTYNGNDSDSNQPSTSHQPAINQPSTTTKNGKKEKNNKIECSNSDARRVAEYLYSVILSHKPDFKKPNLDTWTKDIDKAIRIDKRSPRRLCEVARWAHTNEKDTFWRPNLLSGKKLREKFDQITIKIASGAPGAEYMAEARESWSKILRRVNGSSTANMEPLNAIEKQTLKKTKDIFTLKRENANQLPFSEKAYIDAFIILAKEGNNYE